MSPPGTHARSPCGPCPRHAYGRTSSASERAVREVRTTGRPIAQVAKDLGIRKEALRGWFRRAEADAGERDDRLASSELAELKQLREEIAELRREDEILKAARCVVPVVSSRGW
ncbi:transposase [Streptomyces javensis]|uniref:transposase n=1 Tax=Streptomyces javensis TaxID=114698 RepID=UPI0033D35369